MLVDHYITSQKRAQQKGQGSFTSDESSEFEEDVARRLPDTQAEDRQIDHIGHSLSARYGLYGSEFWDKDDDDDEDNDEEARVKLYSTRDDMLEVRTKDEWKTMNMEGDEGGIQETVTNWDVDQIQKRYFRGQDEPSDDQKVESIWTNPKKGSVFNSGVGAGVPRKLRSSSETSGRSGRFSNISFSLPKRGKERASIDPAVLSLASPSAPPINKIDEEPESTAAEESARPSIVAKKHWFRI